MRASPACTLLLGSASQAILLQHLVTQWTFAILRISPRTTIAFVTELNACACVRAGAVGPGRLAHTCGHAAARLPRGRAPGPLL